MLILSRKTGERILIGENVFLTIIEIRDDKVRLGFDAPKDIPINREEIWLAKQEEKKTQDQKGAGCQT